MLGFSSDSDETDETDSEIWIDSIGIRLGWRSSPLKSEWTEEAGRMKLVEMND